MNYATLIHESKNPTDTLVYIEKLYEDAKSKKEMDVCKSLDDLKVKWESRWDEFSNESHNSTAVKEMKQLMKNLSDMYENAGPFGAWVSDMWKGEWSKLNLSSILIEWAYVQGIRGAEPALHNFNDVINNQFNRGKLTNISSFLAEMMIDIFWPISHREHRSDDSPTSHMGPWDASLSSTREPWEKMHAYEMLFVFTTPEIYEHFLYQ